MGTTPMPVLTLSPPLAVALVGAASFISIHRPRRMSLMKIVLVVGSVEMPPQFMPPSEPGKARERAVPGAV
ncbi:hypothetical protein D3C87_1378160 [compost metagenome]